MTVPRAATTVCAICALTGCDLPATGTSAKYIDGADAIPVQMPPGAPSIQQQFSDGHHLGLDVVGQIGDPVIAAASGRVVSSYRDPAYGERVTLDHGQSRFGAPLRTHYMHLSTRAVSTGDRVQRGDRLGEMGMTGALAVIVPHLHFEVHAPQPWGGYAPTDPHLSWIGGTGRVTCVSRSNRAAPPHVGLTYPVPCH